MDIDEEDPLNQVDVDLSTQSLLLAAANHDTTAVKDLLKTTAATVQDAETGFTPLHAAIASCETDDEPTVNGNHEAKSEERQKTLDAAAETVRLLLQDGAIWNDLDKNNETPGCVAKRLGLDEIYQLVVDAGVRAELLLSKLDEYEPLGDGEDDDEVDEQDADAGEGQNTVPESSNEPTAVSSSTVDPSANNAAYLRDQISISESNILDSATNGVMMSWEKPLMEQSAAKLLPQSGLRVLNIGHGMGIIDDFFQSHAPASHHIVEAHPDVLAKMRESGWFEKQGVVVHEGRWQDVLPTLLYSGGEEVLFDAIYFDTFAEEYKALREFFSEWVVQMLDPAGRFGFFNGMGADRQVCYDVYNKVAEIDLYEAGFDVEWEDVEVADLESNREWNGLKRPYWTLKTYKLPTCTFMS